MLDSVAHHQGAPLFGSLKTIFHLCQKTMEPRKGHKLIIELLN